MIISHRHKFIFVKTIKTAGTSIEIALSKFCGPEDVITPISQVDEEIRAARGYPGPQNTKGSLRELGLRRTLGSIKAGNRLPAYWNHITAERIRKQIGPEIWDSYYTFSFVRNPFHVVVSLYAMQKHLGRTDLEFREWFLENPGKAARNFGILSANNEIIVDKVARFENLEKELDNIGHRLNLPESLYQIVKNTKAKAGYRNKTRSVKSYFDDFPEGVQLVRQMAAREIALFGYDL